MRFVFCCPDNGACSIEQAVDEVYRFVFLAVDDFCVHLCHSYIRMPEQLGCRVEVCTEGKHHGCKRVPGGVENNWLRKRFQN